MANLIPKTETPIDVYVIMVIFFSVPLVILSSMFGLIGLGISLILSGALSPLFMADTIASFHSIGLIDSITGDMRTLFPGINFKKPWEREEHGDDGKKKYTDLRVELGEPCDETYQAIDGVMLVKYVYTIKVDISYDGYLSPGEKVIKFNSSEKEIIKRKGRALVSSIISDYYGKEIQNNLKDKNKITKVVSSLNKEDIEEYEKDFCVKLTFRIEDSDFDKETQKFKDAISQAKSFNEAVQILVDGGMDRVRAEKKVAQMLGLQYKEEDLNINIAAPDLKNLQNVSIVGRGGKS